MAEDNDGSGTQNEEANTATGEQEGTEETTTTTEETNSELDGFTLEGAVAEIKKLRKESASHRVRAKELEDEKVSLTSKLQEVEGSVTKVTGDLESLRAENQGLEIEVQLADKVVDTKKARKLIEEKHYVDGKFSPDKFLEENPFLLKQQANVNNSPLNRGNNSKQVGNVQELVGKSKEEINRYFESLKESK